MAKQVEKKLVDCLKCQFGGTESINHLTDCTNKERNPNGYKVGCWLKECKQFKERK